MTKQINSAFDFVGYHADPSKGLVQFNYSIKHKSKTFRFTETLRFAPPPKTVSQEIVTSVLDSLHLLLGISYWKLFCPKNIKISSQTLTKDQAKFWNTVYTDGLGEFFYKNKIDFRGLVKFPYKNKKITKPVTQKTKNRSLLMIGGGKDSIVSAELLKKYKKKFTPFILNTSNIQKKAIRQIGKKPIIILRALDTQLFKLRKHSGVYNGHIPVTAIYDLTALLAAILYNYRYIVASIEESANHGNVSYLGKYINHQWSKSYTFEKMLQHYIATYITSEISCFSLLRPFTEVKIVQLFAKHKKYFSSFSSCNTNFTILKHARRLWCGKCPKCAFVFLSLAPRIRKEKLIQIFGKNLFSDKTLIPMFEELLGIRNFKPFECVGTPSEVRLAFYKTLQTKEFKNDVVVKMFENKFSLRFANIKKSESNIMKVHANANIPKEFKRIVDSI
ncbi:MAG: hypothetical protein AAB795_02505 [Patescibacteria group bacterium]